jgi:sugar phosphate isomerase/epimerase
MSVFVSSGAFQSNDLNDILALCARHGIGRVELSSGLGHAGDVDRSVEAASQDMELLIHNYFPPPDVPFTLNLASADDEIRRRSIALCMTAIDLCERVGASYYSVHSGFAHDFKPAELGHSDAQAAALSATGTDRQAAYRRFRDCVRIVSDHAAAKGIDLLLENNVAAPRLIEMAGFNPLLMVEADEILDCLDDIGRPNVRLLLDVAHLMVSSNALGFDPREFIDRVGPRVEALHVSDNDGYRDQNLMTTAESWYLPALRSFGDRDIVIESYNLTPSQILSQIDLIESHI